jgi:hypothetical protein
MTFEQKPVTLNKNRVTPLMKKFLKRFAIWTGIILAVLIILSIVVALVFEKPIGKRLVKEINKQLTSELKVGDFDLSLISGFPNASAELLDVELGDAMGGTLLKAEKLAFRFGLFSLFGSDIKVKTVVIENGLVNVVMTDRQGKSNFDIFVEGEEAPAEEEQEAGSFGLSLDRAILQNVDLSYLDLKARQRFKVLVEDAEVSGQFSDTNLKVVSDARMLARKAEVDGTIYLTGKKLSYDADIAIDLAKGLYELNSVELGVDGNAFSVDGWLEQLPAYTDMDLTIKGKEGSLGGLIALLPAQYLKQLEGFESKGTFYFDASLKGRMDDRNSPAVNASFGLKEGRITADMLGTPLRDVSFEARYTNGKEVSSRSSVFELKGFRAFFDRELLEADLRLANFDSPRIDFHMDGVLPMHTIYKMLGNPYLTDGDGEIELRNINIKGAYRDMVDMSRIANVETNGSIEFDDASISIKKDKLLLDRGRIQMQNNNLAVDDVRLEGPGTEVTLNGDFSNILPVLFADSKRGQQDSELRFRATLEATRLDLDRLMAFSTVPLEEGDASEETIDSLKEVRIEKRESFTKFLKGTFEAKVDEFNYRQIEGEDFSGRLSFENSVMKIEGQTKAMGGQFTMDGDAHFVSRPFMKLKLICDQVDIHEFFRQTENFGQEVLVEDNLKGTLESKMAIYAFWDEEGNFLMDELRMLADVRMEEGELVDFEMLYAFSDFLKLKDLRRIRFQVLQNWMEIDKGRLYIPVMFIQSNALNMTISGEHSFENEIDYNFKVNAGQVVANKLKTHDPTLDPLPAKRTGFFNLYYKLFGTVEQYDIRSARKEIKTEFKATDRRKQQIKEKLVAEFGPIINLDEPVDWEDEIPEFEGEGDIDDVEYLDGYDDEN